MSGSEKLIYCKDTVWTIVLTNFTRRHTSHVANISEREADCSRVQTHSETQQLHTGPVNAMTDVRLMTIVLMKKKDTQSKHLRL